MADRSTRRKKPSLAEVAEIAGVSISTVSKVANGSVDVSDVTRERVERILSERGYVATKKRRGSLMPVAILARDMHSPYTLDVIRGAVDAAGPVQVDVTVARHPDDAADLRWIDEIHAAGRRGIIAITSMLDEAQRARVAHHGLALVVIDAVNNPDEATFSVGATNWAGGLGATEHLLDLGHRDVAMLSGLPQTMASRARVSGYRAALNGFEGDHAPARVLPGDFTYDSGLELGAQLLAGKARPTAIFAASDFQALGVLEAARRAGLRVPEDLSVVGFDDLIMAQMSSPQLTSVRQPLEQMGATAVETIVALLGGATGRPHHTELATRLVVRGSTAPPPER
ncbi:transcriptional regulator, LacI family [Beutenbergia cavernae DSM 12333]|uniref:Transcriptional regulator, LacI family n=1 Tax=Beutenbergia cavernae (strain ATCC BAA-8 / DSM 12333 / CCUG 43141 / JCM 11478 / NBRC 16432 / NCIMB 13614 / HKI 0122) TaxID=471853 RepID=C5BVL8_BEUC1|nr:substrate-binding domain-containing protein [Beutenbergia cavernae]ACQ78458.1 transcriptional regulator, LacI family [Beutenbergia cavernae DSM 12333]